MCLLAVYAGVIWCCVQLFSELDFDPSAEINYSEFLAAAMNKQMFVEEERLKLAFKNLDAEGRGYLTRDSVRLALGQTDSGRGGDSLLDALVRGVRYLTVQ